MAISKNISIKTRFSKHSTLGSPSQGLPLMFMADVCAELR